MIFSQIRGFANVFGSIASNGNQDITSNDDNSFALKRCELKNKKYYKLIKM